MTDDSFDTVDRVITGLSNGDPAALEALMDLCGDKLYGLCLAGVSDPVRAEQLMLKVVATIAGNAKYVPDEMPAQQWVEIVARNETVNAGRGRASHLMRLPHLPPDPDHMLDLSPELVAQALARVDAPRLEALRQVWTLGHGYEELSRYFDMPYDQVRGWLEAGLRPLRDLIWGPVLEDDAEQLLIAAEYALGILSPTDAGAVEEMMVMDPALETAVADWYRSFARLDDGIAPVPVPVDLRGRCIASARLPIVDPDKEPSTLWDYLFPAIWGGVAGLLVIAVLSYL